jgi:hypothetical protein
MKFESKPVSRRAKGLVAVLAGLAVALGTAQAQTNVNPAARTHVKMVNGQAVKFSSKLQKVIELNFTFGFHHRDSKGLISATLTRVAQSYAINGVPAFTVQSHVGPTGGTVQGTITPDFTLADLTSGQVIFANQISGMGKTALGAGRRTAIQTAIETNGIGYFHLHGSGDDESREWSWYTNTLHPMNYASHGANTNGPVYKNPTERAHIVTENVLVTGMDETRAVPTSVDGTGAEVLTQEPVRMIRNEWYRFGNDIRTDPLHKDKVTVLSLYDPRNLSELSATYKRKGGNMYTYLFKVGNGMTHYLPAGHDILEITGADGFDGGVGDWDRYYAQVLFFLAGYNQTPCDQSCIGLPLVDEKNHTTGQNVTSSVNGGYGFVSSDLKIGAARPGFTFIRETRYDAQLLNASGKVVQRSQGRSSNFAFNTSRLSSGIYFMQLKIEGSSPVMKRYALTAGL